MSKKRKIQKSIPVPQEEPRSTSLSPFSKVMMILLAVTMMVVMIFSILDRMGLHLLFPEIISVASALVPVLLAIWGGVTVYNKVKSERARRVFRIVGISVGAGLSAFVLVAAAQLTMYAMPHSYGTIESPAGQKVVILRLNDVGAGGEEEYAATIARMNARVKYMNGETAETSPEVDSESAYEAAVALESYPLEAYGHVYIALPKKLGIFYSSNVVVEGEIYRGEGSKSGLFFEWIDDNTVRFYLENPEPGDEGEMTLYLSGGPEQE